MDNTAALCINIPLYMLQGPISMIRKQAMCFRPSVMLCGLSIPHLGLKYKPVTNTTGLCFKKTFAEKTAPSDG